jgi:carbamoylphosphate synthase small subunit
MRISLPFYLKCLYLWTLYLNIQVFPLYSTFKSISSTRTQHFSASRGAYSPKTLIIDNYDSYTYNIWHILAKLNKIDPIVVYNDKYSSWKELSDTFSFDNIVISPGPGNPLIKSDFGVCNDVILHADVPIFGVCLGHQGIANVFGSKVGR